MKLAAWCYRYRIILIVDIVCLILAVILLSVSGSMQKTAYSQQEAKRWSADKVPYHQVSVFWSDSENIGKEQISGVRAALQRKLLDASFAEEGRSGRLWADAYGAQTTDSATRVSTVALSGKENIRIYGVGGSFFLFHPLKMVSGSCFSEDDTMHDRVVIDRETAWELFGGYDIAGQSVTISGKNFVIAGVYEAGQGKTALAAAGGKSSLFMDYSAFHKLYDSVPVTSYEAVLPNPVSTFAINSLQDAVGGENAQVVLVDNTVRFSAKALLVRFSDLPGSFMRQNAVVFPTWENEMRALEWKLFLLLILRLIFQMPPLVTLIFAMVSLMRKYAGPLWHRFWYNLFEKIQKRFYERPVRVKSEFDDEDF
ncbi:MAG: ABC transporter permease [Lachnospiraceae bacterium]|nr:ABC transporter permease [Lachnospiraceae bacterium]